MDAFNEVWGIDSTGQAEEESDNSTITMAIILPIMGTMLLLVISFAIYMAKQLRGAARNSVIKLEGVVSDEPDPDAGPKTTESTKL